MSTAATLVRVGTDDPSLAAAPTSDLRGRTVVDAIGIRVGTVHGLLVDEATRQVRMLWIVSGDVGGLSPRQGLVPVESVRKVDDRVHLDLTSGEVDLAPAEVVSVVARRGVATSTMMTPAVGADSVARAYRRFGRPPFWES